MVNVIQAGPHGTVLSGGRDSTVVHYRYSPPDVSLAPLPYQEFAGGPTCTAPVVGGCSLRSDSSCSSSEIESNQDGFPGTLRICNQDRLTAVTVVTHHVTGRDGEQLVCGFQVRHCRYTSCKPLSAHAGGVSAFCVISSNVTTLVLFGFATHFGALYCKLLMVWHLLALDVWHLPCHSV
jgi:hypothetical protein